MNTTNSAPAAGVPPVPSDEAIAVKVLAGEVDLFELLMRRHNQRVYRAIRSILRSEDEVEEAMQQAYVSAYQHLGQFNGSARFSTWLTRIAVHEALARVRGRREFVAIEGGEGMAADGPSPEERAAGRELVGLLEEAVDELQPGYRSVFMLREVEGLSTAEVAEALSISEDAVKQRLHRAKDQLRQRLTARVEGQSGAAFPFEAPRCNRVVAAVLARIKG